MFVFAISASELVNPSLERPYLGKGKENQLRNLHFNLFNRLKDLIKRLSCFADVDECELGTDICNGNAFCTNNVGLYDCSCMEGYTGDGFDCRGKRILYSCRLI